FEVRKSSVSSMFILDNFANMNMDSIEAAV
ncbi:hypothetical protein C5S35_04225, partial [Candidatus Methanophagaceae archaeon]